MQAHSVWEQPGGSGFSSLLQTGSSEDEGLRRKKLLSRLMYRSKQRGFLELDLLVGLWAQRHLPSMSTPQLEAFGEVLSEENPDLFKWLTGQEPPSASMADNASFMAMRDYIGRQLAATRPPESATAAGKTWLRGWDDWKKESPAGTSDTSTERSHLPAGTKGASLSAGGDESSGKDSPAGSRRSATVGEGGQSFAKGAEQSLVKGGRVLASTAAAVGGEPP